MFGPADNEMKVCTGHKDRETPLTWSFAFPGAEYWCPHCGYTSGMLGAGEYAEKTPELEKRLEEDEESTKPYLKARSTLACYSIEIDGKDVLQEDIPEEMKVEARRVIEEFEKAQSEVE